jgi:hypothetical protein
MEWRASGAGAYVKKPACAFGRELLCSFVFVSVLFVVKKRFEADDRHRISFSQQN